MAYARVNIALDSDDEEINCVKRNDRIFKERINFNLDDFITHFRVTRNTADEILRRIGPYLEPTTNCNNSLTANQQLLIALQFYGSDGFYRLVALAHGVSTQTVCTVVHKVTHGINTHVLAEVVRWPEIEAERRDIANPFFRISGFPCVAGCVDGTLVPILRPSEFEAAYFDRKGNHSLNAMIICGPEMQIYYINSNRPGSVHDARVFSTSALKTQFDAGWWPFPRAVILGDSAYPDRDYLLTPINGPNLTAQQENYNRRHKSTRRLVECAYGIMKESFTCLKSLRMKTPQFAAEIIKAVACLHNLALTHQPGIVNLENLDDMPDDQDHDQEARGNDAEERRRGVIRQQEILNIL